MRVIETGLDDDLAPLSAYLWRQRLPHRVYEERGRQVLEVADPNHAPLAREAYRAWQAGELVIELARAPRRDAGRWLGALWRYPGLSLLMLLTLAAFPFSYLLGQGTLTEVAAWLTVIDPRRFAGPLPTLPELLLEGHLWRWFTPVFLHFSVWHLGFNCAVVVELGRRVERCTGARGLWALVVSLAAVGNLAQYGFGSGPFFGGLSGVAYGLLGFIMVRHRLQPDEAAWRVPAGLPVVLLAFLVILSFGVTEPFGLYVANAAHWGGLLSGVAAGWVTAPRAAGRR
jgi:GlpG protein